MNGKGSRPRPIINRDKYNKEFDRIFYNIKDDQEQIEKQIRKERDYEYERK